MVLGAGLPLQVSPGSTQNDGQCASLNADPFQSRDNQEIFNMIDRLVEYGISKSLGIPQASNLGLPLRMT